MAIQGQGYRQLEGRKTQRVKIGEHFYFIKQHEGIGWKEVFKNLLQLRLPVVSANNEKVALQKLQTLGVAVPQVMGFGKRGYNPAFLQSFILLQELSPTESLEEMCRHWRDTPPTFQFKRRLIAEVARMVRLMHENGINHRDCYLCHFLWNEGTSQLYLIDLHRAQVRRKTPKRWLCKDLAGLYFSSLGMGLTRSDYFYFMCQYRNKSLQEIIKNENEFWQQVKKRGEQLYCENQ